MSWLPAIPHTVAARAVSSTPARQLLSRWLIHGQALNVPSRLTLDADEKWLLSGREKVAEVARELGLKVVAPVVRAVVFRKDVERLRAAFGDEAYAGALDMPGFSDQRIGRAWFDHAGSVEEINAGVLVLGHGLLSQQLKADDRQLKARLRLMFPRVWPSYVASELPMMASQVRDWLQERGLLAAGTDRVAAHAISGIAAAG